MSKYTTQLRFICESLAGCTESSEDFNTVINTARPLLFNFTYPFFTDDETLIEQHPELSGYKENLEKKIIYHYYLREIGQETVGVFKLFLQRELNEIMPYYNQLYLSTLLDYNPLTNNDGYEDVSRSKTGENEHSNTENSTTNNTGNSHSETTTDTTVNGSESTTGNTKTTEKIHDTPQNNVGGTANNYLSQVNESETDATSETTTETTTHSTSETDGNTSSETVYEKQGQDNGEFTESETSNRHIYGKHGGTDYADLVKKYRDTFLNIDLMIINDLDDLFLHLW